MPNVAVTPTAHAKEASISATVIRCGCPPGEMDHLGEVCYRPRATEDLGVVSYWHRNPVRRAAWSLKHRYQEARRASKEA